MEPGTSPIGAGAQLPLTQKFAQYVPLLPGEIRILLDLQSAGRPMRSGRDIISEGRSYRTLFVLIAGVAIRYRILRDGRRHVLNVLLPGDIAGVPDCFFERALYSVRTISDSMVCPVPIAQLSQLFDKQPRLAAKIFWLYACEETICAERLIAVGRMSAVERVAHFLLELLTRLQGVQLADEQSYRLPLTQELIADALGLSIPYVNRVLRQLREEDLVSIKDQRVVINDVEALSALVDFERAYLKPLTLSELLAETA